MMDGLEDEEVMKVAASSSSSLSTSVIESRLPTNNQDPMDICRVCLLCTDSMRGIFHQDDIPSLANKLMLLASVKITLGDRLPSQICCDCGDKLELAYKFKIQVEEADTILRQRLDSVDVKEELFFGDVGVNLSTHKNDAEAITENSVLLKDHIEMLSVGKISQNESMETEHKQGETSETNDDKLKVQKDETVDKKDNDHEMGNANDEEQLQVNKDKQTQEIMLNEKNDPTKMQVELNQFHHLAINEHDYVIESRLCNSLNEINVINTEEIKQHNKDDIDENLINRETGLVYNVKENTTSNESVRRSKRKINQQKEHDKKLDEDNYFENLNLSSRLKQVNSNKNEKVYFMCYLCDKQYLTKEILKEHMYSHEEIRKTLSLKIKASEKEQLLKTPEKISSDNTSPIPSKTVSSGKRSNKCPHCGKEYLYIISFKKHLKQHEEEKSASKDNTMPLEVSFQEDDDILDFHSYEDNHASDSDSEFNETKDSIKTEEKMKIEDFTEKNLQESSIEAVEKLQGQCATIVNDKIFDEQNSKKTNLELSDVADVLKNEQVLEVDKTQVSNETLKKNEEIKKHKCPHCSLVFRDKNNFNKHLESHKNVKNISKPSSRLQCNQCNKSFGNELTLKNHLIATGHKTTVHGEEYNTNKRIKRVAAKAAQKIIDKIKSEMSLDESDEEQEKEQEKDFDYIEIKEEQVADIDDEAEYEHSSPKKSKKNSKGLICETCGLKCTTKQSLARHTEQHTKEENKQDTEKKIEDHPEDDDHYEGGIDDWQMESHECPTCKKNYSTKKSLLRHQLLHEDPNYECDICNVKFYRKDKLKTHYDKCSEKNPDQVRKCNICGDTFENNEVLREHRVKHVEDGILTEEDLLEAESEDKNNEKLPRKRRTDIVGLECTECNKRYSSRKGLLRHLQVHEGKKYLCDMCPKKFYRREHLKIHVAKHNMVKPFKCTRCSKRFIKEEQLNNHILKHDRTIKKPKESTSDGTKRFLCEICSKSFTQSTTLVAHLRAHNGIKPYICEVCSRPFTTNAYLKMHMRTHTQERPYICHYCSRAFARADTLANHLTSHTGEAKYHCKYCPKNFRRLKSLKEHVFIHTGQRPYACPTCDRRFNNNGSRYAHSKRCKQNQQQSRSSQVFVHSEENVEEQQEEQIEPQTVQLQLIEQSELEEVDQSQAQIVQRIGQVATIKPQSIKTITIARPVDGTLGQQHVMAHQEILMPLILPFAVALGDCNDEVILPEGTKIFTT